MTLPIEYLTTTDSASADSLFLTSSDLKGQDDAELSSNTGQELDARVVWGFMESLYDYFSANDVLGMSMTRPNPASGGSTYLVNQQYSFTFTQYLDIRDGSHGALPSGSFGLVSITDVFPNAEKVSSGASPSNSGVAMPYSSTIAALSSNAPDFASLDLSAADHRSVFVGLAIALFEGIDTRTGTISSAFVNKARNNPRGIGIGNATLNNSSLGTGDRPYLGFIQQTVSSTLQWMLDISNNSFEVNVTTT